MGVHKPSNFTYKEDKCLFGFTVRKDLPLFQFVSPQALKDYIEHFLDSKKAQHIVSIDLQGKSSIADYLVIASGSSQRQISSMAELLREDLKKKGLKNIHIEGLPQCAWVLVDVGDVIVHLFRPEVRLFYNLEKIWGFEDPNTMKDGSNT